MHTSGAIPQQNAYKTRVDDLGTMSIHIYSCGNGRDDTGIPPLNSSKRLEALRRDLQQDLDLMGQIVLEVALERFGPFG